MRTIMLVDDEPDNLRVLEGSLTRAGYHITAFSSGALALEAAQVEPPDLILLDVRMPEMDGLEVCRRLKQDDALRKIPVIFISALTAAEDIQAGFQCGGVDYIAKPVRTPEVLARVRNHLTLRDALEKIASQYEHLKDLERHRDSLVHLLVHDMRAPLQVSLSNLELVLAENEGVLKPDDVESLQISIHCTKLLGRMISHVVDVSRMEAEGALLKLTSVCVSELVRPARMQAFDLSDGGRLKEEVAVGCPRVRADAELCVRTLANLFDNALKYAPEKSVIVFGAEPCEAGVRLWVRSAGDLIPEDFRSRMFDKFAVGEHAAMKVRRATGLGLYFCKLAVEAQGGTIGVDSSPDSGNTFWFTLPRAESE